MDPCRGDPVYVHRPLMKNSSLRWLIGFGAFSLAVWLFVLHYHISGSIWDITEEDLYDPVIWVILLSGLILVVTIVSYPFLFMRSRFKVTTYGVQTSYNGFQRLFKGYPVFIEYNGIETIFLQFVPGTKFPEGKIEPDTLHSLVILTKDGNRYEIPWGVKDIKEDNIKEFLLLTEVLPDAFMNRLSSIPTLSEDQKKISEDAGDIDHASLYNPPKKILATIFGSIFLLILIIGPLLSLIYEGIPSFPRSLLILFSLLAVIPVVIFFLKIYDIDMEFDKARASAKAISSHDQSARENGRLYYNDTNVKYEEIPKEKMEKSINSLLKYRPCVMRFMLILGTIFIILGFVITLISLEMISAVLGIVLTVIGFILFFVSIFFWGMLEIEIHKKIIYAVYADEIRLNKNILSDNFKPPKWLFLNRGIRPVTGEEMDKVKKWTRFHGNFGIIFSLLLIINGVFLMFIFIIIDVVFNQINSILISTTPIVIELLILPIGVILSINILLNKSKLTKLGNWEQRSGIRVMDDVLRERWEKSEEERRKAQGG